jgi:hypothetical protein
MKYHLKKAGEMGYFSIVLICAHLRASAVIS